MKPIPNGRRPGAAALALSSMLALVSLTAATLLILFY